MRIVLTGGVTGGHIYPAIAIGDKFREADPDCEVIYIASGEPLEREIISGAGYELFEVQSQPFYRNNIFRMAGTLSKTLKGRSEAKRILKEFRPDAIISTGSYVSVPVVLAGASLGTKIYLHEQNGFPGVSNKFLARYAKKVFLGFESASKYFDDQSKVMYSGNPVRQEFLDRDRAADRAELDIPEDDFVIMVFGGSLGSETTNVIAESVARKYADEDGVTVIWGTGRDYYDGISSRLEEEGFKPSNVRILPYISDMPAMLSACDITISRSGALSVAETTMAGRLAIFVPSPNVTEDHQYYNAKAVADAGGAFIVREDDGAEAASEEILGIIGTIHSDSELKLRMEEAGRSLAPVSATEIIYNAVMEDFPGEKEGETTEPEMPDAAESDVSGEEVNESASDEKAEDSSVGADAESDGSAGETTEETDVGELLTEENPEEDSVADNQEDVGIVDNAETTRENADTESVEDTESAENTSVHVDSSVRGDEVTAGAEKSGEDDKDESGGEAKTIKVKAGQDESTESVSAESEKTGEKSEAEEAPKEETEDRGEPEKQEETEKSEEPETQELSEEDKAIAERIRLRKIETRVKNRRHKRRLITSITLIVLAITAFALSFTSIFTVDLIEVKGNTSFSAEEIISMAHASAGKNIIYRPEKDEIKENLEKNPYIKSARVSRKLPSTLVITVSERQQMMALKYDDDYLLLDRDGILLQKSHSKPKLTLVEGNIINRIKLGEQLGTQNEDLINKSINLIQAMTDSDLYYVKVDMSDTSSVKAYVYDTLIVKTDYDTLMKNMKNGRLHMVLDKLFKDSIKRGTITFVDEDTASFMPVF